MKKTAIFLMATVIVTCINTNLKASWEDIVFTENGIIQDGDQYVQVFVYGTLPNTTTVEMTGGKVGALFVHDYSTVNISGGIVDGQFYSFHPENNDGDDLFLCPPQFCVNVSDHSAVNISGGSVDSLKCEDWCTVNITGGYRSRALAKHAPVNISGGRASFGPIGHDTWSSEDNNSHLYISGGQILGSIWLDGNSTADIYGYGFSYDPYGGQSNGGQLMGFWQDHVPFSIDFLDFFGNHSYDHAVLHEIPEPATLLLLGLGMVLLHRKRR